MTDLSYIRSMPIAALNRGVKPLRWVHDLES